MEEIQLSNFQKNIYSVIDSVMHSHQPVLISDKGKFLVKIVPLNTIPSLPARSLATSSVLAICFVRLRILRFTNMVLALS